MGFAGARPKEDRSQIRHRNPVHEFHEIPNVPFDGPKLPVRTVYEDGKARRAAWPADTRRWWEAIRQMPHAKDWTPGDWEYAYVTASLHAKTVERGVGFTELRQREYRMGTTLDARNAMRIRYVVPSTATQREQAGEVEPAPANVIPVDFGEMYG